MSQDSNDEITVQMLEIKVDKLQNKFADYVSKVKMRDLLDQFE